MTRRVLIAGASGLIGTELRAQLREAGDEVVRLVRRAARSTDEFAWDPEEGRIRPAAFEGVDAVVNLSGASLNRLPWTPGYKRLILQSRLDATNTLAAGIGAARIPPAVFVSASAVGVYGDRGQEELTEASSPGDDFLSGVVTRWETAAQRASEATRVATVRTGVVLSPTGGALAPLRMLARAGFAGRLGTGRQWWPWVSLHDEAAAIRHIIASKLDGPVNVVGPEPATASEIIRALAKALHRPYWLPVPSALIVLALRDAGRELLLGSQRVVPRALLDDGFVFAHPLMPEALAAAGFGPDVREAATGL